MNTPQHRTSLALVVFSIIDGRLGIILKKRELPRLLVDERTKLNAAARELSQRIVGDGGYLEQLYTFSPRTRENPGIIVSYFLLMPSHALSKHIIEDFVPVSSDPNNVLDKEIVAYALQRLRWKVEYTNVVYGLLPQEFTLSELQRTYEAILGRPLDKRNFRKKILSLRIFKDTGKKKRPGRARPAEVYTFTKRQLTYVEVL